MFDVNCWRSVYWPRLRDLTSDRDRGCRSDINCSYTTCNRAPSAAEEEMTVPQAAGYITRNWHLPPVSENAAQPCQWAHVCRESYSGSCCGARDVAPCRWGRWPCVPLGASLHCWTDRGHSEDLFLWEQNRLTRFSPCSAADRYVQLQGLWVGVHPVRITWIVKRYFKYDEGSCDLIHLFHVTVTTVHDKVCLKFVAHFK